MRATLSALGPLAVAALLVLPTAGCRSLRPSDGEGLFADSLISTDSIRGPIERVLAKDQQDPLAAGQKFSAEGRRQVEAARKQFDDGKYAAALKNYEAIASKYSESAIGEEAWFRIAECHYELKQYPKAQDAYEKLFADYPSTKYVSKASQRLFVIARSWLEVADPTAGSTIKTVSQTVELDEAPKTESSSGDPSVRFALIPNFFDKTRPLLDTRGRARKALKSIWLNDPTGPLADDALMLTATYYLKRGNHVEADRYFENLREMYPDSPHLEKAFVLGSHAKQMSYQGPYYDNTSLVSARNLKEQTLTLFPNSEDREQVRKDLKILYLREAQDAWADVELYQQKDNPAAIAIHCRRVIEDYGDTRYAEMARRTLLSLNPKSYQRLPGMKEFVELLPKSAPARRTEEPTRQAEPERRVKSVSATSEDGEPAKRRRWFGIPGF
ncbi:MAG: outer membrane protein assembly factor BamD [Planctomycetaceae bacterium]|nr:outer membrane protein assembly factor BamD [Planctomycetaceae bacterium]